MGVQHGHWWQQHRVVTVGDTTFAPCGIHQHLWDDLYHRALTASWPKFFGAVLSVFLAFNVLFALIYQIRPGGISNEDPSGLAGAFFFSVETLATVGYGDMHPLTLYAHLIATGEIMLGVASVAVLTGLIFARFSRPRARIIFGRYVVVHPFDGKRTLMIRAANTRLNLVTKTLAHLHLLRLYTTREGYEIRRIQDLRLVRSRHPIFVLGWNLMHVIDETSPLYGASVADLEAGGATLLLTIEGIDATTSQTLVAEHQWGVHDIRWNHRFADFVSRDEHGINVIDYTRFHDVLALEPRDPHPPGYESALRGPSGNAVAEASVGSEYR